MSKERQGRPWRFVEDGMQVHDASGRVVCGLSESSFGLDEDLVNGRLLASAPELKRERDTALTALALSVDVVRELLRANDGRPFGDDLRQRILEASEAAAVALRPWSGGDGNDSR